MRRRPSRLGTSALLLISALSGCKKAVVPPSGGAVAVLIDRTLSVSAHRIGEYPAYFNGSVVSSLRPGERILIESISDQSTLSDPPLRVVDTTLPAVTPPAWTFNDDYVSYARKCQKATAPQVAAFESATSDVRSKAAVAFVPSHLAEKSFIVDGIEDVAGFLSHQNGPKTLVLFTDGIEDSDEYAKAMKFDAPSFWQRNSASELIAELKSHRRVPNLSGVSVYFVGAAAQHPEQFRDNQAFWEAYFTAAGVAQKDLHYGHQPSWEEASIPKDFEKSVCDSGP